MNYLGLYILDGRGGSVLIVSLRLELFYRQRVLDTIKYVRGFGLYSFFGIVVDSPTKLPEMWDSSKINYSYEKFPGEKYLTWKLDRFYDYE